ncbi:hypothetical protein TNCV_2232011 [Trichonephila clavipes]|nr:hypothetical protein TNCV_2232011 [Trichonephila clavipes]
MPRSSGQSEARSPVSPSKFDTQLSTHCSGYASQSRPCPTRELNPGLWCGSAIRYHLTTGPDLKDASKDKFTGILLIVECHCW